MFEPVHGSAPDIAGFEIANPIGAIWAGAMMMEHLGCKEVHDALLQSIERVLKQGNNLTQDMGGQATTKALSAEIRKHID